MLLYMCSLYGVCKYTACVHIRFVSLIEDLRKSNFHLKELDYYKKILKYRNGDKSSAQVSALFIHKLIYAFIYEVFLHKNLTNLYRLITCNYIIVCNLYIYKVDRGCLQGVREQKAFWRRERLVSHSC